MSSVKFIDHSEKVKGALAETAETVLEEVCGELESQVKRNTAVASGDTKNAWSHQVTSSTGTGEFRGTVGNSLENAIWEEFGTGEYALEGKGRKGGWLYVDDEGKGHFTRGKRARRPFHNAYTSLKTKLIRQIQDAFKGGLS